VTAGSAVTVSGISVELSHADKVFFPDSGITKGDLVGYYRAMAGRMLPYLRDRPLVMARYPDGITGERIFQKNVPRYFPDRLTVEQRKDGRGDRVYSDVMRNAYAQTVVAPYTVRARPGARVATPLSWEELKEPGLTPGRFTLRTIGERLDQLGRSDPWAGLGRRRYGLARASQRLEKLAAREP